MILKLDILEARIQNLKVWKEKTTKKKMIKNGEQHLSYWVIFLLRLTCQQVRSTLWKCHLVEADPHLLKLTLQVRQRHTSDTVVFSYSRPWSHVWKYMLLQMNTWHCPRNQRPFRGPGDWPLLLAHLIFLPVFLVCVYSEGKVNSAT